MPSQAGPSGRGLTSRAAGLGLVVCALAVTAALPLRDFLDQRGELAAAERRNAQTRARVAALEEQARQLKDPAYVQAEARRRLHFVTPGETAYVLIPLPTASPSPSATPSPGTRAPAPVDEDAPWWTQAWSTVRAADRP